MTEEQVGPLVETLAETHDDETLGTKLVEIARAHADNAAVLDAIGAALFKRKRRHEAREVLDLAEAAGTESAVSHHMRGRLLMQAGDPRAEHAFRRAFASDPEADEVQLDLAVWLVESDPEEALQVISMSGNRSLYAFEIRAMALEKLEIPGAATELARPLAFFGEVEGRHDLVRWHCNDRRHARGLVHARALFERRKSIPDHELEDRDGVDGAIALAYRLNGVIAELLPWLRERTGDIGPRLALQLYASLGTLDPQLAIRSGEVLRAAATGREERLWRIRVARLRANNGEAGVLEALAASGLDDDPVAWIELSNAYADQRQWDAAHAALDRALELDPNCPEALVAMFMLARILGDDGVLERTAHAIAAVKPYWHQGPEHLARLLARRGDIAALDHAKRAASMAPHCHNAWLAVGEAQLVAGDLDDARAALARAEQITPAEPPDDISILRAALDGRADLLERELAERYKHLPALPFPAFVEKLREVARAPRMP